MNVLIFTDVNGVIGFGRYAGSYRVATELRKAGYSTQVIEFLADLSLKDIESIADKFIDENTLFVSFSTTLLIKNTDKRSLERLDRSKQNRYSGHLPQNDEFVEEMFAVFRRKNQKIKIVLGGGRTDNTSLEGVDYWFWGMSDTSVVALAKHLKYGEPLKTIDGLVGKVIRAEDYPYHDFDNANIKWEDNDYIFENEHLPIEIARGCIYRCIFCANPLHKKVGEYVRTVDSIREEMLYNYEKFKTTGYMFCDDTFNDTHKKVKDLHKMITSLPFQIEWTGYGRADVIHAHPEQREMLLETGLKAILIGIETFGTIASKGVGKGLDPELMKETLYYIHEAWKGKVVITGSFIVGLPGESEESIWKTVEWLQREDCPIDDVMFSPLNIRASTYNPNAPLSKIARNPAKYGYTITGPTLGRGISTEGPQWENEFMDKNRAETITRKIQEVFHKENPIADWAVYSRLRSIGYSSEELLNTQKKDILYDANKKRRDMYHSYMNKLLS
ncbi:B12-binding domain-containing radical SAM protein [Vallitalea sp.]|jgi:radical SAM superfamily enzyme YgiQ (UPF0313 family)|uniref:B12-binding domain-containing radical SAM protein n=1 Tax=Vallitalea sp. TaxID=1882829 RepID=UPI0025EFF188|nr:radical SAM protein [Vallitalea sp.]MCT4686727.1 radical SAM protein [Vallitalea sp.]